MRYILPLTAGCLLLLTTQWVSADDSPTAVHPTAVPTAARQAELRNLLAQDCGSCHGLTRRGGLGPPLRAEDLAGKPPAMLRDTILNGRPGTAMPPWGPFMTPAEAQWLVDLLLNGQQP